jgi:hypothetical protein
MSSPTASRATYRTTGSMMAPPRTIRRLGVKGVELCTAGAASDAMSGCSAAAPQST